ncbi:hypothetical protein BDB01DRAFT_776350 [Pilobolus umbonatus]|nr:hypothetical protein BDB01DRAFT_776350 [Pilobolus umbonatus]
MPPFYEDQVLFRRSEELSRTQYKLQLQRQSFLTHDKHYLDHPKNMIRLTKELDRVSREYRLIRQFEDPIAQSFERLRRQYGSLQIHTTYTQNCQDLVNNKSNQSNRRSHDLDYHPAFKSKSSITTIVSNSTVIQSTNASTGDKINFVTKWFIQQQPQNETVTEHSLHIASLHPTIIDHMRRRTRVA